MIRTVIQLTEEQATRLRSLAERQGISVAALVREGIEAVLAQDERAAQTQRFVAAAGILSGGPTDLAYRHDDYLVESIVESERDATSER
jgi:hypothetical protein